MLTATLWCLMERICEVTVAYFNMLSQYLPEETKEWYIKPWPCFMGLCLHSMVHPWVADGDGLQIWTAAVNILNKPLKTTNKGWSSSLGCWSRFLQFLTVKRQLVMKCYTGPQNWLALVDTVMNLQGTSWIGEWLLASLEGLWSM
jgi:hypothetical protein